MKKKINERKKIDDFLELNSKKQVVVVQGLGFVGAVMSLVCANALTAEYAVIGVDLPNEQSLDKINKINSGIFPLETSDLKIQKFYKNSINKKNFYATYDEYAYSKADVIIIDINLDVQKKSTNLGDLKSYDVTLASFKKAIKSIALNCKEEVLILVETTVPPGTCKKVVYPLIKDVFDSRNLDINKVYIGHSYERVMPGPNYIDSIQNFYRVYSGINEMSSKKTESFLKTIIKTDEYPLTKLNSTNSTEMAKVLENSFRAMNIAFIVEWTRFAEEAGVNFYEIIDAIRMRPTHKNIMYPGIGVGGYCLTKDPLLASWSRKNLFDGDGTLKQSEMSVRINDKMPSYAISFLEANLLAQNIELKNVALLGVSYRSDVGDTRYSPVQNFYIQLQNFVENIYLTDPYVKYWDEMQKEIDLDFKQILSKSLDSVIITTSHSEYKCSKILLDLLMKKNKLFIYDTVGLLNNEEIKILKSKHLVRVLGRGDIN
tara:strand:- start:3347 stop:4807 length:1461 start_codon:yes stop_codon:yes gene_type:complete